MFYWRLMLLWMMVVGFENTCTVSGMLNVFKATARLYGWVYKILRLLQLLVELWIPNQG